MPTREFQFSEGSSHKFWRITVEDKAFTVVFGKVGTSGQTQSKEFTSSAEATKAAEKLISEKVKKGYSEVAALEGTTTSGSTMSVNSTPEQGGKPKPKQPSPTEQTPAPQAAKDPEPADQTVSISSDNSFRRELFFNPNELESFKPYVHRSKPKPEIRHFNFDDCIQRFQMFWKSGSYAYGRKREYLNFDWSMSREEARFWFELFGSPEVNPSPEGEKNLDALPSAIAAPIVTWDEFLDQRSVGFLKLGDMATVIFFKLFPLEDLLRTSRISSPNDINHFTRAIENGFKGTFLHYLSQDEFETLAGKLPDVVANSKFPSNPSEIPPVCFYLARTLGMVEVLKPVIEAIADDTYPKGNTWDHTYYHQIQEYVFTLRDPKLVEHHFRRLKLHLHKKDYLLSWLAITKFDALDYLGISLFSVYQKEEAVKLVQILAESIVSPEIAQIMLGMVFLSKTPRQARKWLEKNPVETIVGLIPMVAGNGRFAEAVIDYLRGLKRRGYAEAIASFADQAPPEVREKVFAQVVDYLEKQYPSFNPGNTPLWLRDALAGSEKKAAKLPGWCDIGALPPLTIGEFKLNDGQITALLGVLQTVKAASIRDSLTHPLIAGIRKHVEPTVRDHFGWKLFEGWQADGAASKEGWAFLALGLLGHDPAALKLAPLVRAWPGDSQHARAVTGLDVLRAIGTDTALMQINGIAQKVKFKGLKTKAEECMEAIASDRGMTRAELEDRIVPDCDLDERGGRTFDFGPRQFRMLLCNDLKPAIREADGKVKPDLPKPNAKDDPALSAQAVSDWKLLKKQVSEVAKIQAVRLEQAMVTGRRWPVETFELLIVRHPLMTNLAQKIVWATYGESGKVTSTFRVSEDRTYSNAEDLPYTLASDSTVGVVHPLHLNPEDSARWGELFGDYEIMPPFPQLGRTLLALEGKEAGKKMITRFEAIKIPPQALVFTLEKLGWERGTPQDGGCFFSHSKPFYGANVTAVVKYEGVTVGYIESWEDQKVEKCYFLEGIRAPQSYPPYAEKNALKLSEIDPVVISEVLADLTFIASKGK